MLGGLRFRPIGWAAALGTLATMAATLALAAPGGATPGLEKGFEVSYEANCILAPGVLNERGVLKVHTGGEAPGTVEKGDVFSLRNARIAITAPKEWGELFFAVGSRSVRGLATHVTIHAHNAEPETLNVALPPEFPSGLPIKTKVENREVEFIVPSEERRFTAGPWRVTGSKGEEVLLTIGTEAGFKEVSPGHFESTGEGILYEVTGFNEAGEANVGPIQIACTSPTNLVFVAQPIVGEGSSTTTSSSTTTTTTTTTIIRCLCVPLNDRLTGSLTVRKLSQAIALPEGCRFVGEFGGIPGPFEARTTCPPFTTRLKILRVLHDTRAESRTV